MSRKKPMPLSDLPGYMRRAREHGQGEDIPVVDVGRIVDDTPAWRLLGVARYAAGFVVVAVIGLAVLSFSTESLTISSGVDASRVAGIVSEEGGRVFSVSKNEDGTYRVRVFSLRGSLLERLRGNGELESVDLAD